MQLNHLGQYNFQGDLRLSARLQAESGAS